MDLLMVKKSEANHSIHHFNNSLLNADGSVIHICSEEGPKFETSKTKKHYQKSESTCSQLNRGPVFENQC